MITEQAFLTDICIQAAYRAILPVGMSVVSKAVSQAECSWRIPASK